MGKALIFAALILAPGQSYAYDFTVPEGKIILISDTQATDPFQRLIGEEDNTEARAEIYEKLAEENPNAILHAGDIVNIGAMNGWYSWNLFKEESLPIAHIPMYPALGNHEYFGPDFRALEKFYKQFPHLINKRFYSVASGRILFLVLDSNFKRLKAHKLHRRQLKWLKSTLQEAQKDKNIQMVAALFHHPPYTNAKARHHESPKAQKNFVSLFNQYKKVRLVVTGHTHNYERFQKRGIHYMVIGGAGGPRDPVFKPSKRIHEDLTGDKRAIRDFHYVRINTQSNDLKLDVIRLNNTWEIGDTLTLAGPPKS